MGLEFVRQHASVLVVMAPLVGAALAALLQPWRLSWVVCAVSVLVSGVLAFDLAWRVLLWGESAAMAAQSVFAADGLSVFAAALVAGAGTLALIAGGAVLKQSSPRVAPLTLALSLCLVAGWLGALLARDLIAVAIAAECAWLSGVVLAATASQDRGALNGAIGMLIYGGVAGALLFLGVGLTGVGVGAFETAMLERARIGAPMLASAGVGLMLVALALKAGVAPLHAWSGAAFGRAGAFAGMMLGVVGMIGALGVLCRVAVHALGAPALGDGIAMGVAALGVVSVLVASVQAIGANSLPRLAAYAAAAQAGCILVSVALGSPAGIAAALVQLVALCASALALFGALIVVGAREVSALDGLSRRAPLAAAAITAGALGLMGAPLTAGFLGRWRMIEAAVGAGWWWAACAAIAASLAGVFYGGRLIERVYFRRAAATTGTPPRAWRLEAAPALAAAIVLTAIGLEPSVVLRAAAAAAALMTGGAP